MAVRKIPGTTLKQRLWKSDIGKKQCGEETCMVCQGGNGKHCREDGVTCYITCKGCGNIYIGKMASKSYTRGLEHARVLKNKSKDSDLFPIL